MRKFIQPGNVLVTLALLLLATPSFAALPPTANLVLWLNPDSLTGLSQNDPVHYWADTSPIANHPGVNHNAVDRVGWATPVYANSANGINGVPGVKFGASNLDSLWIEDNATTTDGGAQTPIALTSGMTFAVVFKIDPADPNTNLAPLANYNILLGDSVDAMHFGLQGNFAEFDAYNNTGNAGGPGYVNLTGTTVLTNTNVYPGHYIIATHAEDVGFSNDMATLYADNRLEAGPTVIPYNTATQVARIGQNASGGGYGFNGWISEVLVYNTDLSDPDRLALQAYLDERYSIPEPASAGLIVVGGTLLARRRVR